jgi:hypothetical protein
MGKYDEFGSLPTGKILLTRNDIAIADGESAPPACLHVVSAELFLARPRCATAFRAAQDSTLGAGLLHANRKLVGGETTLCDTVPCGQLTASSQLHVSVAVLLT